jgi:myo-inositol-1(or 4)-monophosphatase
MINIVKKAAIEAGEIALSYFNKTHTYHQKDEASNFSTEADLASEKAIHAVVKKYYPDHNFLSEEMGFIDNHGEYTWVCDPIDGTFAYSRGLPYWGVSIGVFHGLSLVFGVINMPLFNNLYYGQKGMGVFCNNLSLSLSCEEKLEKSLIAMELGYFNSRKKQTLPFSVLFGDCPATYCISNCTVYDLALVASGLADGFIEETPFIWDIAAGVLLIEELGGKVTDWKGQKIEWKFDTKQRYKTIASNGLIHKKIQKYFL